MTQFFTEDFEGVDGTQLQSYKTGWRRVGAAGLVDLLAGRAKHASTSNAAAYYYIDAVPPSPDYIVRGSFYFGPVSGASPSVGIMGRVAAASTTTGYQARIVQGSGLQLVRFVAGSASTLVTLPYTPVEGGEALVELRMFADQISVHLNGALAIGPLTDAGVTAAGYPGLRTINASLQIQISEMSADDGVAVGGTNGLAIPAGVECSAQVGAATATGGARGAPAGVSATASIGTASASAGTSANALPAGVSASGQVGSPVARGAASAVPAGVAALAQVGNVTASGGSASTALPAGVSAVAAVGAVSASGAARAAPVGVTATASLGTASASAGASVSGTAAPSGVSASASVGTVTVSAGASCAPAGVAGFASVGAVIAAGNIAIPATAAPLGVAAYARVGTAVATGGGVFARAPAGSGYIPQRNEYQSRPVQIGSARPAAIQRNRR